MKVEPPDLTRRPTLWSRWGPWKRLEWLNSSQRREEDAADVERLEALRLDQKYQDGFAKAPAEIPKGGWCPPCPRCGGVMKPWDTWLVTGANCQDCNWGMTEGSGSLL